MPEKILIPLDGSKLGEAALRYVEELIVNLSAEEKIEVTLIQVLPPTSQVIPIAGESIQPIPLTEEDMEPIKNETLEYLNRAAEGLRKKGTAVNCEVIIGQIGFSSAEEIIKAEDYTNADLVAMSTHGRRGLSKWVLGSVTEKVLRAGKVPLLVVRTGKKN